MEINNNNPKISLFTQIRQKGIKILWHNTKIKAIVILIGANIANNLVAFLINLFIAKKFGPNNYGIFALAMSFMEAFHLVADIGLSLTIVRFFNLYDTDEEQQKKLLASVLILKLAVVLLMILIAWPLGSISLQILKVQELHKILFVAAAASVGVFGLWAYYKNILQAHRKFSKLAIYNILYAGFRVICFITIYKIFTSSVDLPLVFISLYTIPLLIIISIGFLPLMIRMFKERIPRLSVMTNIILRILKYGKWVALSGLCHSFIYRGIQFILSTRTSKFELGIFSAGFVFTLAFSPFNMAVRTVFFPHVTAFKEKEMKRYFKRIKKVFPYYIIIILISITVLAAIQVLFLGEQYANALPVFLITSFSLTLMIFLGLISMLVHTLMRPEIDAYTNIGRLVVSCILAYFLAPTLGAIGGALSYALPILIGELLMVMYVMRLIDEKV